MAGVALTVIVQQNRGMLAVICDKAPTNLRISRILHR
jgi:hypothetical protein